MLQLMMSNSVLSDFVRASMASQNLSSYDVARRSKGGVSQSTITKLLNDDYRSHSIETLSGLARGLGVAVEDLINAARGITVKPARYEVFAEAFDAHDLDLTEWEFLEQYFKDHVARFRAFKDQLKMQQNELARTAKPKRKQ